MKTRKAYLFAKKAHKGQLDDLGKDYVETHLVPGACAIAALLPFSEVQLDSGE